MKQWHFYEPVFRRWVVLLIGSLEDFKQELEASQYKELDEIHDAKGMCVELNEDTNDAGQYCTMLWLKEWETASLIHELSHMVMFQFDQVGVEISRGNTEPFAFYIEYWWTEINKVRRKYPNGRKPSQAK